MFLEAATHIKISAAHFFFRSSPTIFNIKICSEAAAQIFHVFCAKRAEDFHNLSMIMKNIFYGLFKNLTVLYECHQPRHNAYRNRQIIRACFAHMS